MSKYDPIEITQKYVYGADEKSNTLSNTDYNDHIRPDGSTPPSVQYDMLEYLTNGAGRYAIPSIFPIVDKFFQANLEPNQLLDNPIDIQNALGYTTTLDYDRDREASIWQYGTDTLNLDYAERAYIFGTTPFVLFY